MKLFTKALIFFLLTVANLGIAAGKKNEPETIKIGTFLTSIYDINADRGTFSSDFWVWTLSPKEIKYKMNDSLEINYSNSQFPRVFSNQNSEILNQKISLQQKKIQGVFLHDFDLDRYPFDSQKLQIFFEDGALNSTSLKFEPDKNSGYDTAISIDGWKIKSVSLSQDLKVYDSNFGNFTTTDKESYSRIILNILIERDAPFVFFKLTMGLFLAVFVALCSCFMPTHSEDIFSGRMGLLGGTLLAVVVNQQFVDAKQGETTAVTLIDSLHMLGMFTIMILLVLTTASRFISQKDASIVSAHKVDVISFIVMTITFVSMSSYIIFTKI
jgi:hypothetical protein